MTDKSLPTAWRADTTWARTFASRSALACMVGAFLTLGACSQNGPVSSITGDEDHPRNGTVSIREDAITGSIESGVLKFEIPLDNATSATATGKLFVSVIQLDGGKTLGTTEVAYTVPPSAGGAAQGQIAAPTTSTDQADLTAFNLRIESKPLRVNRSLLQVVPPYEVRLEGPATVAKSKNASYRIVARNMRTEAPVAGVPVSLAVAHGEEPVHKVDGTTSATGEAVFPIHLEDVGSYRVTAQGTAFGVLPSVQNDVAVEALGSKILLTTDKPIYKPGQVIHTRALALNRDGNKPMGASPLTLEIEDGKGNKILKKSLTTDAYGIASNDFAVAQLVNTGTFKIRGLVGDVKTEKTVTVSQYALPKFDVTAKTDKPWYQPGEVVTGTLDARYFFGKLVAGGSVTIEAASLDVGQTVFQKFVGKLDEQGHIQFSIQLPNVLTGVPLNQGNGIINLRATVADTAGQQVEKNVALTVAASGVRLAVVPEGTNLVPAIANELLVFATDPLGNPIANASVELTLQGGEQTPLPLTATTDAFGEASLSWTPPANPAPSSGNDAAASTSTASFAAKVTPAGGTSVNSTFHFKVQSGQQNLLVRTDKAVYDLGETVKIDVTATSGAHTVYVDWLNDGQAVDMRSIAVADGKATFEMPVDGSLAGSNRIEAYIVDASGNIVRSGRTIFARNRGALSVSMSTDKPQYAPGDPAKLTFSVKDEEGRPAVAALGVQIVDQAVFSLVDAHPGLLRSFFEIEDTYAKPTYELTAPPTSFDSLLFQAPADPVQQGAHQTLARGAFAALGQGAITGIAKGSWPETMARANKVLEPAYKTFSAAIAPSVRSLVASVLNELSIKGCSSSQYRCGDTSYDQAVSQAVVKRTNVVDFWGNTCTAAGSSWSLNLTSRGPDEIAGTQDDHTLTVDFSDLRPQAQGHAYSSDDQDGRGRAFAEGADGAKAAAPGGNANLAPVENPSVAPPTPQDERNGETTGGNGSDTAAPRVRRDFPETLYVNPAVITGPDGTANVSLDLADSITEWRVSTLASSLDGRLGGGEAGFTVFQDFFVDVNFPATLTRGDEVSFPIAVYNYLGEPQTVNLALKLEDWYTALGATTLSLTVQPGQVLGASFPVRVEKVGMRSLTVTATGSRKSDAVARTVQVVPDGKTLANTFSGLLEPGTTAKTFDFPTTAVVGSEKLFVEVYPGFLAQVVKGMDSMLQQPTGCFEQTTSSTWPNVLILSYMTQTKQLTPEIQMKAESLISAGYQRLLTFEHPGGGFSWFGTQDPAPYLSVTAFGVMEFSDMAKVATVDEAMLSRTVQWLAGQQQADGSWKGDQSEFFTFHASTLRNSAFVLWALASAGYQGAQIGKGVEYVKGALGTEAHDAYTLGLVANALQLAAPSDPITTDVYNQLDQLKKTDGDKVSWTTGGSSTCFYESGRDSDVTATALALHALLLRGGGGSVDGALRFITAAKDANGNFGATQATVWALRALLLAASKGTEGAVGTLTVNVDGVPAQTVNLTKDQSDVMTTVDLSTLATSGSHAVDLAFAGTGKVSFNAVGRYNLPWALAGESPEGPIAISVAYDKTKLFVDDEVTATATVRNTTNTTENMVLVTLGIPPGFSVNTDDLATYISKRTLSKFELTGKQLMLYVSKIAPSATTTISYKLRATMPVKASDGGGQAYLYYEPARRVYATAQALEVAAK